MTAAIEAPPPWWGAARAVAGGARRVLVVGAVDTGKSTFCRWLLGEATAVGIAAAMVDADPGQPGLGPPACLAAGLPGRAPERLRFLGVLEPLRRRQALLDAISDLTRDAAAGAERLVVVNTCGFIHGAGAALQAATLRAVRPDLVVCLEREAEAAALRRLLAAEAPLLPLPSSPAVRRKSHAARRRLRAETLARHFEAAREVVARDDTVAVEALLPLPEPLPTGLLCAVADAAGVDLALALLRGRTAAGWWLLTAADPGRAARVRLGGLVVEGGWDAVAVPQAPPRSGRS